MTDTANDLGGLTASLTPLSSSLRNNARGQERATSTDAMCQQLKQRAAAVRIGRTQLGRGVFARRRFHAEQVIGVIRGQVIDDPGYTSNYCMELGDGRSLEPIAPFRYLNHSCDPNCELFSWESDDLAPLGRLWLQALKPIEPGEELTIDYAWPADAAIPCGCGAAGCRGWIVALEELSALQSAGSAVPT